MNWKNAEQKRVGSPAKGKREESEFRSQKSGDRSQKSEDRSQKTGVRSQESGERKRGKEKGKGRALKQPTKQNWTN